jgi:hypothetical protein
MRQCAADSPHIPGPLHGTGSGKRSVLNTRLNCVIATKATTAALEIRLRPAVGRIWPERNAKRCQGLCMSVVDDALDGEAVDVALLGQIGYGYLDCDGGRSTALGRDACRIVCLALADDHAFAVTRIVEVASKVAIIADRTQHRQIVTAAAHCADTAPNTPSRFNPRSIQTSPTSRARPRATRSSMSRCANQRHIRARSPTQIVHRVRRHRSITTRT